MQKRAGNTSLPRWWKQTEQYLCELMRTENNLFEQNEKCEKHIEASPSFVLFITPAFTKLDTDERVNERCC